MLQILFVLFLSLIYLLVRHFWRNRGVYMNIYRIFSGAAGNPAQPVDVKEKRIITCPHCGSTPEVTHEACSKCGKLLLL
jgi:hypothetical protein